MNALKEFQEEPYNYIVNGVAFSLSSERFSNLELKLNNLAIGSIYLTKETRLKVNKLYVSVKKTVTVINYSFHSKALFKKF